MTSNEAIENVRMYERHQWTFDVDDDGVVYVGGTNHDRSIAEARKNGHDGPIVHVYTASAILDEVDSFLASLD